MLLMAFATVSIAATANNEKRIETFPINSVRLADSQFLKNQQADIHYLLGLDADRLLAPYLKGAGLPAKADNYSNWENTGLDGHIGGHYVSALSYMVAATGNKEIAARLDYVLSELKRCQDAQTSPEKQALFGIMQGGMYEDLRRESAARIVDMDLQGYSIGGLSVGEPKEIMIEVLDDCVDYLPAEKPRYLMGVGTVGVQAGQVLMPS